MSLGVIRLSLLHFRRFFQATGFFKTFLVGIAWSDDLCFAAHNSLSSRLLDHDGRH